MVEGRLPGRSARFSPAGDRLGASAGERQPGLPRVWGLSQPVLPVPEAIPGLWPRWAASAPPGTTARAAVGAQPSSRAGDPGPGVWPSTTIGAPTWVIAPRAAHPPRSSADRERRSKHDHARSSGVYALTKLDSLGRAVPWYHARSRIRLKGVTIFPEDARSRSW